MRTLLTIFIFSLINVVGKTQDSTRFTVKAGQTIAEAFQITDIYLYPEFRMGTAYMINGEQARAKMNYDRILEAIVFVDFKGDTMLIANQAAVKLITINTDTFFCRESYMQLINNCSVAKLAVKERLRLMDRQKIGAYGVPTSTASIDGMTSLLDNNLRYRLVVNENLLFQKDKLYFIGNKKDHFVEANRKNVLNEFSKYKKALVDFLEKNDINFKKEQDLIKLCKFLEQESKKSENQ